MIPFSAIDLCSIVQGADALLTKDRALLVLRRRVPFRILAPEAFETALQVHAELARIPASPA